MRCSVYDGDQMAVLFDSVGYKTLSLQLVVDGEVPTDPAATSD